jgi:hypothetical protein
VSARRTKRTVFNAAPEYDVDVLQNSIVRAAEDEVLTALLSDEVNS